MLNKVILIGRTTKDVDLRKTSSGTAVATFTLALDNRFVLKDGKPTTDFINCVAWRQTGEFVSKYFTKGSMIVVSGRLQIRPWTDKDGNKRTVTDIVANEVEFLSSKGAGEGQEEEPRPMSSGSKKPELEVMADDDQLPF